MYIVTVKFKKMEKQVVGYWSVNSQSYKKLDSDWVSLYIGVINNCIGLKRTFGALISITSSSTFYDEIVCDCKKRILEWSINGQWYINVSYWKKHNVDVCCKQYIKAVKEKEKSARERRWYDNK